MNRKTRAIIMAALCCLMAGTGLMAERTVFSFDTPDEVKKLDSPNAVFESEETVAGEGAIRFIDKPPAQYDGKGLICSFPIPRNTHQGVLTLWIYDQLFDLHRDDTRYSIDFGFSQKEEKKTTYVGYQIVDFRTNGEWLFGRGLFDLKATKAMRHPGWTRFDVINPAGDEPQHFKICIDGREVAQTKEKLSSINSCRVSAGSGFYYAPILIDEVSYDTDLNAYRPNVVQAIDCGGVERSVELQSDEKLSLKLKLAPKGTRDDEGELTVRLLNGMEKEVSKETVDIDWEGLKKEQKGDEKEITVILPSPPRSGYYWLEASYKEDGWKLADIDRQRVDVQFLTAGFENNDHSKVVINTPWDFVPVDDETPHSTSRKSTETPKVPEKVPSDWSMAVPLTGPWYCWGGGTFRCLSTGFASWYRQVLQVPKNWKGRRILLDIDDPQTVAYVFINGKRVGVIENPGGNIDITSKVNAGDKIDVALFIVATGFYGKVKVTKDILGERYKVPDWASRMRKRGLMGEVSLVSEPMASRIESVVIRTYVEKKKLWLAFNCENLIPGESYTIKSAVSTAGDIVKEIPAFPFKAKKSKQRIEIEVPWEKPHLWNIGHPHLYDFNAKLLSGNGKNIDTIYPIRFGFREILFKNQIVTLNGKPVNLFHPLTSGYAINNFGFRDYMTRAGFTGLQKIDTIAARNAKFFDDAGLELRYKAGDGFSQHDLPVLAKYGEEKDPRFWDQYKKQIEYLVKKNINNPSVLFWRGEKFSNDTGLEMNPMLQDGIWTNKEMEEQATRMEEVAKRTGNIIRMIDPTRYQSALVSQNYNDTIDCNYYTGFNPIQELIERNEYWRNYGEKPYFIDEYACPFHTDWCNSPWEGGGGHRSPRKVPQIAEWLAVTKGDQAFVRHDLEQAALKAFEKQSLEDLAKAQKIKDPQERKIAIGKRAINGIKDVFALYKYNYGNPMNQLVEERLKEQVLNWRADGVGMMCYFGGGQVRDFSAAKFYKPVIAFLAGTPEKRTAKDHIFTSGETLKRSVLILNNERFPVKVRCDWKLTLDDDVVAEKSDELTIDAGGQVSVPIEAKIPAGGDRKGTLATTLYSMEDVNNGTIHFKEDELISKDSCSIQIIAPRKLQNNGRIAVIDPEGDSIKALERIGVKLDRRHFNSDLKDYDTIIFGRRAFDYEVDILESGINLGALTAQGKNIVILEQSEQALRNRFKLRTEYTSSRYAYPRFGANILFDGLGKDSMNYWRGASTLTDGYEVAKATLQPEKGYRSGAWYPYVGNDGKTKNRFVKWGNTHNLVTVMIIKPDTGNFRTLVDCGFALNYAGTLELLDAKGRVIFNQLDVSGRTENDPAAERFLANLIRYAESAPKPQWHDAVYVGGEKGKDLLTFLRIDFKQLDSPSKAKKDDVMIVGDADAKALAKWEKEIQTFVADGGIVFCLPKEMDVFSSTFFPFKTKVAKKKVNCSVVSEKHDKLLRGLGNSDLYWKGDIDIVAIEEADGAALKLDSGVLARIPYGKGEYVLCQIAPEMFDVGTRFWLENSKRRNERLIIRLLNNLDVRMKAPYFMSSLGEKIKLASTINLAGKWSVCPAGALDDKCPVETGKNWKSVELPGSFQKQIPSMAKRKGYVWFKHDFEIKDQLRNVEFVEVEIGQINGADRTYINGEIVGEINMNSHVNDAKDAFRRYSVPVKLLKAGKNQISVFVEFNADALLGMAGTDGEIFPPLHLNFYAKNDELASTWPPLNLEGKWQGVSIGKTQKPCPPKSDKNWHDLMVPGAYENQHPDWEIYDGYFWYRKIFKLSDAPAKNAEPFLLLGGIDDWDTTYVNGKEIGHTTPQNFFKMASAYNTPRKYPVPASLLKKGDNEITILVDDPHFAGGITSGPVELVFADPIKVRQKALLNTNYLNLASSDIDPYVARHW